MKRLLRGSVILAVAVGFLSCSGDPTDSFREPSGIVADPTALFIDIGETKSITVSLQDDQGNQIATEFEISDVGPGVSVGQDTTFQHTNVPGKPIGNFARFQVTGSAIANSSFTLSAGGKSLVVPVRVTPNTVSLGISNANPAWGESVVLTALAGVLFTDSSEVTFAGGPPAQIVDLSADQTQLTVIPGPNTLGAVTVAHATVSYNQGLDFTITSQATETVTSPPLTSLEGAVLSNPTPALGETVTLTLPAGIKVLRDSFVAPDSTPGVLADSGLLVEGATNPRSVSVSTDSSIISFIPAPNSDSFVTVKGVVPSPLPQFPQILTTTIKLTTPVVDSLPANVSSTSPAANVPVVLTSTDPSFTFVEPGTVTVGGAPAIVTGQTATTLTFLPAPSSTGNVAVGAVDVVGFGIPLPSTAPTVTTGPYTALPGSDDTATAPVLPTPVLDARSGLYDVGSFAGAIVTPPAAPADQAYRFNVATAGDYTFTVQWNNTADVDVALCAVADCSDANFFAATGDNPESDVLTLTPGTYYLVLNLFAGDAPSQVVITVDHTATVP